MRPELLSLLKNIQKPYRLAGGEYGSTLKPWDGAAVRVCLAFPDVYEMGMSHLGLAILYDILNSRDDCLAERVFAPWADVEKELRNREIKLFSLESQHSLDEFDVIGTSLPYELTYTNILNILDLGGIPLRAGERGDDDPLVIAGGPCAFNPEPVAEFFDAIVLGDGEDVILQIAGLVDEYKRGAFDRRELLEKLAGVRGVYVPSLHCSKFQASSSKFQEHEQEKTWFGEVGTCNLEHGTACQSAGAGIRKAIVADIDASPYPHHPIVAHAAVQDRAAIEIQRGCVRGCRFCQAGMIYRPVRQRSPDRVCELAMRHLESSGHENLSLLSLSAGDYACLESVLAKIGSSHAQSQLNMSLPSLRTESLTDEVVARLGNERAGSFTLAPEAATERMRMLINKGNTDEDLYASVEKVFRAGWSKIKLYFMIGLPTETQEEIDGIVKMSNRCLDIGRKFVRKPEITVSTSTFVPKPHTPLQWARQISIDDALKIQADLKRSLRRPGLYYRWHDARMSLMECVMSRGGRELSQAIERAYRAGARFDGWDECFCMDLWRRVLEEENIDPDKYRSGNTREQEFPWDHLYVNLKREFLWDEYERALRGEPTPSCDSGSCQGCGVCDFTNVKNKVYNSSLDGRGQGEGGNESMIHPHLNPPPSRGRKEGTRTDVRIRFSKTGRAAFLGHLELMDAMRRNVRRARLPVEYSQGFHPRPVLSLGRALSVGIESECEYMDLGLSQNYQAEDMLESLNRAAPEGIRFHEAHCVSESSPKLDGGVVSTRYEVSCDGINDLAECVGVFSEAAAWPVKIIRRDKEISADLKSVITELAVVRGSVLGLSLSHDGPSIKVTDALKEILKLGEPQVRELRVKKMGVVFGK